MKQEVGPPKNGVIMVSTRRNLTVFDFKIFHSKRVVRQFDNIWIFWNFYWTFRSYNYKKIDYVFYETYYYECFLDFYPEKLGFYKLYFSLWKHMYLY